MSSCIYKIISPSNRVYIGQATDFEKRIKHYRLAHCKTQKMLYNSLVKYGFEAHDVEVLDWCDVSLLNEREVHFINKYKANRHRYPKANGLNCTDGGLGMRGFVVRDETKQKLRSANLGKEQSPETIEKRRQSHVGKKMPDSFRRKMSVVMTGSLNHRFGKPSEKRKPVHQFTLNGILIKSFESIRQAKENTGVSHIGSCVNNKRNSAGGYLWSFEDRIEKPAKVPCVDKLGNTKLKLVA